MPPRTSRPRPRRRWLVRAGLVLGSVVATLAAGEFAVRWHVEGSFLEAVDSILGLRTAAEPGQDGGLVADPLLGYKLSPSHQGVNSRGVRHAELEPSKPPGQLRIFMVGDSVGFPLDGFFRHVERTLRATSTRDLQFVNACVHGYTTYQERYFLERDLLDLAPDVVILQYCVNDNHRFLHRLTSKGRRLVTLEAKNYLLPEGDGLWPRLSRASYLAYAVRRSLLSWRAASELPWEGTSRAAWSEETWPEQEEHLRSMAASVRAAGGRLMVMAVPHEHQLAPEHLARDRDFVLMPQRRLGDICAKIGVPFLDLHPALAAQRGDGLFTDTVHLSPKGHELVGTILSAFLVEHGLVPAD
jgi:lysophospholipase L1-like esterase